MMTRSAKAAFYVVCGPVMKLNGILYRSFRSPRGRPVKVHIGPGQNKYLPGWINIDANMFTGKCDVWVDLRNPLPFGNDTCDAIYSHHVVEHLPSLECHFKDVFRCLRPGGVYRVGGPNGDSAIRKYLAGDPGWFPDFPDKRSSIGGRLENFVFCRGEHLTILTRSFLEELMSHVGFVRIATRLPVKETGYPDTFGECLTTEWEADFGCPHTLIVEAEKPSAAHSTTAPGAAGKKVG